MLPDASGDLRRQAGHGRQLVGARGEETLRGAEVAQDRPPALRADAREVVEDARGHAAVALPAVVAEREPVRLVADLLEQPERG
jgi:hypothetical protein